MNELSKNKEQLITPLPNKAFMFLKPLSDELHLHLVNIYKSCQKYIQTFCVPERFAVQMVWPETAEDFKWICSNILPWFGLSKGDCVNLDFGNPTHEVNQKYLSRNQDRIKGFRNKAHPPYQPNAIVFIKYTQEHSISVSHRDQTDASIIIPVVCAGQAETRFPEHRESISYPCPALIDASQIHEVIGLERLQKYNINERVLLNISLRENYQNYINILPRPNGW